jgi:ubiquinone/menaquinone biosynthesis C-methylase UbiE
MRDPRTSFEPVAASYLTSAVHSNPTALDRMVQVVRPNGGVVVDAATGAGHAAYSFASYVDRVIATDITPSMLKLTRQTADERGIKNLDVCFALAEELPFQSGRLTGVTCRMGAHHFNDVPRFVAETHRALKSGGWLLIVDTIGDDDDDADEQVDHLERVRDPSHRRNYRTFEWKNFATRAGFMVEHTEESWKDIEVEDWMERMRVSDSDRTHLRELVDSAKGKFADYLKPETKDGKKYFHLKEMLLFAKKA